MANHSERELVKCQFSAEESRVHLKMCPSPQIKTSSHMSDGITSGIKWPGSIIKSWHYVTTARFVSGKHICWCQRETDKVSLHSLEQIF